MPAVAWLPEDNSGRTCSECKRFEVFRHQTTFSAIDHAELDSAFGFPTREAAQEWCRKQLAAALAAERVEAEIEAVANPNGAAGAAAVEVKPLEWTNIAHDKLESVGGRFRILTRVEDVARRPTGKYVAVDTFAEGHDLRFSADLSLDDAKAWCRERSKYDVQTEGGVEYLFQVREDDGSLIPF